MGVYHNASTYPHEAGTHTHASQCAKNKLSLLSFLLLNHAEVTVMEMRVETIRTVVSNLSPSPNPTIGRSDSHDAMATATTTTASYPLMAEERTRQQAPGTIHEARARENAVKWGAQTKQSKSLSNKQ